MPFYRGSPSVGGLGRGDELGWPAEVRGDGNDGGDNARHGSGDAEPLGETCLGQGAHDVFFRLLKATVVA